MYAHKTNVIQCYVTGWQENTRCQCALACALLIFAHTHTKRGPWRPVSSLTRGKKIEEFNSSSSATIWSMDVLKRLKNTRKPDFFESLCTLFI